MKRYRGLAVAAALALALVLANDLYVVAQVGWLHGPKTIPVGDHFRYIAMARGDSPEQFRPLAHQPPFCYRVLTPWIAGRLAATGLGVNRAFYLVSQTCLFLFLLVLYAGARARGLPHRYALLGIALAGLLQGAVRWYAFQYWMTDPLGLLLLAATVWMVDRGRLGATQTLGTLGLLNRETQLAAIPYLFLRLRAVQGASRAALTTVGVMAAPVIAFLVVRAAVFAPEGPGILKTVESTIRWRLEGLVEFDLYATTLGSFGAIVPLLLLPPTRPFRKLAWRGADLALIAMVYGSLLVANNTDRLLAYALPVLLPTALFRLRLWVRVTRVPLLAPAAVLVALQLLLWVLTHYDLAVRQPTRPAVVVLAFAVWITGVFVLRLRLRKRP